MNKRKLSTQLAKRVGIKGIDASKIIDATFDILRESMEQNEKIIIHGFGSFIVRDYAQRKGVNPHTFKMMNIDAHKRVKFNQSKMMQLK